jgi:hypothetical protein
MMHIPVLLSPRFHFEEVHQHLSSYELAEELIPPDGLPLLDVSRANLPTY